MNIGLLDRLENNPKFSSLTYEEQIKLRSRVFLEAVKDDTRWQQLSPGEKLAVLEHYVYKPPKFENPAFNTEAKKIANALRSGEGVTREILNQMGYSATQQMGFIMTLKKYAVDPILKKLGADYATNDAMMSSDNQKYRSWVKHILDDDLHKSTLVNALSSLGSLAGFASDLIATYVAGGAGTFGRVFESTMANLSKNIPGRLTPFLVKKALPITSRVTLGGLEGVAHEYLTQLQKDPNFKMNTVQLAKTFGDYAALDYVISLTLGLAVPYTKMFFKTQRLKTFVKKLKNLSPSQFADEVSKLVKGERIDPALWASMPESTRFHLKFLQDYDTAAKMGEEIVNHPYYQSVLAAGPVGAIIGQTENGLYQLRHVSDLSKSLGEFDSLAKLNRQLAGLADDYIKGLKPAVADAFRKNHEWLFKFKDIADNIDDSISVYEKLKPKTSNIGEWAQFKKEVGADVFRKYRQGSEFVDIAQRGAVTPSEADKMIRLNPRAHVAQRVYVDVNNEVLARVSKGETPFDPGTVVKVSHTGTDDNAVVILHNVAPLKETKAAVEIATRMKQHGALGSIEDLTSVELIKRGYDGALMEDGLIVLAGDKIKIISESVDPFTGKFGKAQFKHYGPKLSTASRRSYVATQLNLNIPNEVLKRNKDVLIKAVANLSGDINTEDIRKITNLYLSGTDAEKALIHINQRTRANGFVNIVQNPDGTYTLNVPHKIANTQAQRNFTQSLFNSLGSITKKGKLPNVSKSIGEYRTKINIPGKTFKDQLKWLSNSLNEFTGGNLVHNPDGTLKLTLLNGQEVVFNSLDEAADHLIFSSMGIPEMKIDLGRRGYNVRLTKHGTIEVYGRGSRPVVQGKTAKEVYDALGLRPEKISARFAPRIVGITDEGINMTIQGQALVGNSSEVSKFLDSFEDYSRLARYVPILKSADGVLLRNAEGLFEVTIPGAKIRETFTRLEDAKQFLRNTWNNFDNLQKLAEKKGFDLYYKNGTFTFVSDNGYKTAKSIDEVKSVLADSPDPSYAPPIMGETLESEAEVAMQTAIKENPDIDLTFLKSFKPKLNTPPKLPDPNKISISKGISRLWTPFTDWMQKIYKDLNDPELLKHFRNFKTGFRTYKAQLNQWLSVVEDAFKNPATGRTWNQKTRKAMYYLLAGEDPADVEKAFKGFKYTDAVKASVEKLRTLYGKKPTEGLAFLFNIEPKQFITNYISRVRDTALQVPLGDLNTMTAMELLQKTFNGNPPTELTSWFRNSRAVDLISFAIDDDALSVTTRYVTQGLKEKFLGPAWTEFTKYINANKASLGEELIHHVNIYRDKIMGYRVSDGEKLVELFGMKLAAKLKPGDRKAIIAGKDILQTAYSLNYMTTMAWRPFIVLRNLLQPWSTLASRFGNTRTMEAWKYVADNADDVIQKLMNKGIITDAPPIIHDLAGRDNLLGKLTHKGLASFKRSDDITRAVAWRVAETQWEDAVNQLKKGLISTKDEFLYVSGLSLEAPDVQNAAWQHVLNGNYDAGLDVYGAEVVRESMFEYSRAESPFVFDGLVGKAFGQYGTYAANYFQNILRGIKRGTPLQRVAFFTRWIGNMSAIGFVFRQAGIDPKNFIPWAPMMFAGGPMFDIGVDVMRSLGTGYKSQQARAELDRLLPISLKSIIKGEGLHLQYPSILPGYYQARALNQFMVLSNSDKPYLAWLALTTTPIRPDLKRDYF